VVKSSLPNVRCGPFTAKLMTVTPKRHSRCMKKQFNKDLKV